MQNSRVWENPSKRLRQLITYTSNFPTNIAGSKAEAGLSPSPLEISKVTTVIKNNSSTLKDSQKSKSNQKPSDTSHSKKRNHSEMNEDCDTKQNNKKSAFIIIDSDSE